MGRRLVLLPLLGLLALGYAASKFLFCSIFFVDFNLKLKVLFIFIVSGTLETLRLRNYRGSHERE